MKRHALCVLAALAAAGGSFAAAQAQVSDRNFPVGGAAAVRLNVSGNVHLMPSASAQTVRFHIVDYGPSMPPIRFTTSRTGRRLTVTVTGPSRSLLPFTGASGYELQIIYPANLKVDLREFSGHVQADQLNAETSLYDADGSITVAGASAALTAEADSGSIDVTGARANVQLTAGTGPVNATLVDGWRGSLVRIESSDGALHLSVPSGFRGSYDLTTASGTVHNSQPSSKGAPVVFMLTQNGDVSVSTNSQ